MGQHYLIDLFGNPVATARIIDVQDPTTGTTLLNGSFIIRVPGGIQVINPANVTDLLNQKYQNLLANNPTFTRITFDDLLDATHVDPTSGPGIFGQRGTISIAPGGTFVSIINGGAGTPLTGATPLQALVTWEVFSVTDADPSTGLLQRTYNELTSDPSNLTCDVSFNGGITFNATTDSSVILIDVPDQGNAFIVKYTNVTQGRLYLGSWALVY